MDGARRTCRSTRPAGRSSSEHWTTATDGGTANPHLVVTRGTKGGTEPASSAYFTKLLRPCGLTPRSVRCTRLADLVNTLDPKPVAAAFGMDPQAVMFYLRDHVDEERLPR